MNFVSHLKHAVILTCIAYVTWSSSHGPAYFGM